MARDTIADISCCCLIEFLLPFYTSDESALSMTVLPTCMEKPVSIRELSNRGDDLFSQKIYLQATRSRAGYE